MRRSRAAFLLALLAALIGIETRPAWAHPLLLRASPLPGALLRSAPTQVWLLFSEDLTSSGSRLLVVDHLHHAVTEGRAALIPGNPREIAVRLRSLRPGSYLVSWTVVSAEDGHVVRGSYLFSVKVRSPGFAASGAAPGAQGLPDADTIAGLLAHWLLLLAAVTWFGSAAFSVFVLPSGDRQPAAWRQRELLAVQRLLRAALVALIATNAIALLLEAHELTGGDWGAALSASTLSTLLASQHGELWIIEQIVALLALASTLSIPIRRRVPRWLTPTVVEAGSWHVATWVQIPLGLVFLYALAASGHAASADVGVLWGSHLVTAAVAVDMLHLLAVALWLGGQIYIVLVLVPTLRPAASLADGRSFLHLLDRFSPIAYGSVAAFVLTGPFNAKIHIPSWSAFFATTYGRALSIKMVLVGMMMLVSAFSVYTLRPRIRQALDSGAGETVGRSLMQALLGWLRLNPVLGAGVLLATSVMFFYPVPASFSQSAALGPQWRPAGLPGGTVHLLVFGHRHPALAFAATEQGVYRLQGATWQRVLEAQAVWSVALSNDDNILMAGDEAGDVSVSRDGGATWRHGLVTSQGVYAVSIRPGKPRWLLAGGGQGLYLSRDGGLHWERRMALPRSAGSAFAWEPGSTQVVFAGVVASGPHGSTSVYVSRDGGLSWQVFGHGLHSGGGIMSLAVLPSGQLFAGTMGYAIWTTSATDHRWHRVSGGMPVTNDHVAGIAWIPGRPGSLFVATLGQGVFRSVDGGTHWTNISAGLPTSANDTIVLSLAYSPFRKALYAGTIDGVYVLSPAS